MTLMKGERGNNQRSQYFTRDTDAYSDAAASRDHPAVQMRSHLTLRFNATFLSLAHSSLFSVITSGPHAPPITPPASAHPALLPDCS